MGRSLKSLLLLLSLITITIFVIQNRQLITIIILNRPLTIALPLGIWVLIFMIAGIMTSLIIKLLNPVEIIPVADTYSPKNSPKNQANNFKNKDNEELENEDEDEWNIEEPPIEPTRIKPPIKDKVRPENFDQEEIEKQREREFEFKENQAKPTSQKEENVNNFEPQKPPSRPPRKPKSNQVYDANYRVITPPYRQNEEQSQPQWNDDDFDF